MEKEIDLTVEEILSKAKTVPYHLRPAGPRCVECGRRLTSVKSVARGIGPACLDNLVDDLQQRGVI